MAKKIALGKGIASLIQDNPSEVIMQTKEKIKKEDEKQESKDNHTPYLIDIDQIEANPNQPRKIFKQKELQELSASIEQNGIIQPLIVVKKDEGEGFELIAGERRLRAAKMAGLEKVPAVVKRATERDRVVMAIIENVQRSDLNCVEEALAYYQLMDEYELNQEELAKKLGKERSTIANYLRILKLPRQVVEMIQKDLLTFGHAKVLAAIKDKDDVTRLANEVVANELSVRQLEELSKKKKIKANTSNSSEDRLEADSRQRMDDFRQKLERSTGFHCQIASKKGGKGQIILKFNNEAEFNDIYEFLLSK